MDTLTLQRAKEWFSLHTALGPEDETYILSRADIISKQIQEIGSPYSWYITSTSIEVRFSRAGLFFIYTKYLGNLRGNKDQVALDLGKKNGHLTVGVFKNNIESACDFLCLKNEFLNGRLRTS